MFVVFHGYDLLLGASLIQQSPLLLVQQLLASRYPQSGGALHHGTAYTNSTDSNTHSMECSLHCQCRNIVGHSTHNLSAVSLSKLS